MTVTQFGVTNALEYLIHNYMLNLNVVLINMILIACVFSYLISWGGSYVSVEQNENVVPKVSIDVKGALHVDHCHSLVRRMLFLRRATGV